MALLFCDGMDHYNASQAAAKWDLGSTMTYNASGGRFSGGSLASDANNSGKTASKSVASGSTFIIGFALKIDTIVPTSASSILRLVDSSTVQTELKIGTTGQISVVTNGSTVASSSNGLITLNTWNHIEWKITVSASTGANQCVVRLNNVEVINATGVATKTSSNTTANVVAIGQTAFTSAGTNYDDLYILDNTGSRLNDLIGDSRIETLYPDGAGNYTQLTANGAATNWQAVSEHPADDDTSYVAGNSVGGKDSYSFTNPVGTITTVWAVQMDIRARKDNAGTRTIARLFRSGSTDYVGGDSTLSTTYSLFRDIMELNPATGVAWTSSEISAIEAGIKVTN